MVIFTSFKKSKYYKGEKFSIARFQPKVYGYKDLKFLAAEDEEGNKILLRSVENPIEDFKETLRQAFKARGAAIKKWLESLDPKTDVVLCCWCPYSKSTQKQFKERGSFVCHSGLIAQMIRKYRPDVPVQLDDDRQKYLIEEWKPDRGEFQVNGKEGLTPFFSKKIGDYVVIAKDKDEAKKAMGRISAVVYTEDEVNKLRGKRKELVKMVHDVKKILMPWFSQLVDIVPLKKRR